MDDKIIKKAVLTEKEAKVDDATDVWKQVRDYILGRNKKRYSTIEELKDDVNSKFKEVMQNIQENYDRFFDRELLKNLDYYGVEILGDMGDDDFINENEISGEEENPEEPGSEDMNGLFDDEQPEKSEQEIR